MNKISDELRGQMSEMYLAGMKPMDIAVQCEVSLPATYKILKDMGVWQMADRGAQAVMERQERVITAYANHEPIAEICANNEISLNTMYLILREAGIVPDRMNRQGLRQEITDKAMEWYQNGVPLWKIQEEFGLSSATLYQEVRRRGLKTRREQQVEYYKALTEDVRGAADSDS